MGQSNSKAVFSYNQSSLDIIKNIQSRAKKLRENYTFEFLDENFCNRVALLFNDKLAKFRKQEIDNVRYTLGIVNDNPETKNKICQVIVDHYVRRLKLIANIENNIDFALNRIYALTVGPRCDGYPETFNLNECNSKGGRWSELVTMPEDIRENKGWYQQIHDMQREYVKFLKRCDSILVQLDDFDEYVNDEKLSMLEKEFDKLVALINRTTYERYRMILATRTYTQKEVTEANLRKEEASKNYAAQNSALRMSKGLPPLKYQ